MLQIFQIFAPLNLVVNVGLSLLFPLVELQSKEVEFKYLLRTALSSAAVTAVNPMTWQ
jgi:hypothetical protein